LRDGGVKRWRRIAQLRGHDPEMPSGLTAKKGARLATLREQEGPGFCAENAKIIAAA
jgi:hypothetical protein